MEQFITKNTEVKYVIKEGITKHQILEAIGENIPNFMITTNYRTEEVKEVIVNNCDKEIADKLLGPYSE